MGYIKIYIASCHSTLHMLLQLQKDSPFLEDFNHLLDIKDQMGRLTKIEDYIPNSTKCMTWQDVKASHEKDNPQVVVRLDDIYGMAILLALGLGGALVALTVEFLIKAQKQRFMKTELGTRPQLITGLPALRALRAELDA